MRPDPHAEYSRAGRLRLSGDCVRASRRLLSYLDGELSPTARQKLEQHLGACPSCRRELQQLEQSEQALRGVRSSAPAPGDLRAGFYARLAASSAPKKRRIDWRVAVPALAACALVVGWFSAPHPAPTVALITSPDTSHPSASSAANNADGRSRQVAQGEASVPMYGMPAPASRPENGTNTAVDSAFTANPFSRGRRVQPSVPEARNRNSSLATGAAKRQNNRFLARPHAESPAMYDGPTLPVQKHVKRQIAAVLRSRKSGAVGGNVDDRFYADLNETDGKRDKQALGVSVRGLKKDAFGYQYVPSADDLAKRKSEQKEQNDWRMRSAAKPNSLYYKVDASTKQQEKFGFDSELDGPQNTLSLRAEVGSRPERSGEIAEDDGVSLQVRDTQRGFASSTRLASQVREENGRRVLTIEADDADVPASVETEASQPAAPITPSGSGSETK